MRHGEQVSAFESAFAEYVNARFAVAMTNGTVTLQVALMALGLKPGDRVATSPLTMAATTIAILNAGGVPVYEDVDADTWLMAPRGRLVSDYSLPVSLYGLHQPFSGPRIVDDAAQTLRKHGGSAFTSYSLQRSKILNTGEGGVLVTDDEGLATAAREIASLGYKLGSSQSRIDSNVIKSPTFERHHRAVSLNARMNDLTAAEGLKALAKREGTSMRLATGRPTCRLDELKSKRCEAADVYADEIDNSGCNWLTPQRVPEGWQHDYWTFAVACDTPQRALDLSAAVVRHGGEKPFPAWQLTYREPAFRDLVARVVDDFDDPLGNWKPKGICPIAESLQPRLLQFQTNDLASAERNATALRKAIEELS